MSNLVSILIPVYNARPWVERAIKSALAQTWSNKEIIAVDDASTDGSWDVLQAFASVVRIERVTINGGQNVTRNRLTELSQGEWLLYLDADDELTPDCVAQKMCCAEEADAIYGTTNIQYFNGDVMVRSEVFPARVFEDPIAAAFHWKYPNTSSFMFRRSAVLEVGGWNGAIKNCTDYDLYFRLLVGAKRVGAAPDSVTIYRQWSRTQAVNEAPERKMLTRLELMWRIVLELESTGQLSPQSRESFASSALAVIRILYTRNTVRACHEHRRLASWNPSFAPQKNMFPSGYRFVYRIFGFRMAEIIAALTRSFRPRPSEFDFSR
jgi:glycosyltransferase involved in cell wall biosynthesis